MHQLPKWAIVALAVLLAGAAAVAIVASVQRFQLDRKARKMLEDGKLQLALTKAEITAIGAEIRKASDK